MSVTARITIFAALVLGWCYKSLAQSRTPSATWILPGASWRTSKKVKIVAQVGYNKHLQAGILYPQGFITLHKNLILNPAYIFLVQNKPGPAVLSEHYLMNAVILQATSKVFFVEDRNMLWNRIPVGSTATHYYRNRLKAGFVLTKDGTGSRLYACNEIYYLINTNTVTRNRIGCGINTELIKLFTVDISYVRQWDRYSGSINLFFVMLIWRFQD